MPEDNASVDFSTLLDGNCVEHLAVPGSVLLDGVYDGLDGLQFRTADRKSRLVQEVARIADEALLLATDFPIAEEFRHHQIVEGSDWIHLHFRQNGGGSELISDSEEIQIPAQSCVVIRYPRRSIVHRTALVTESLRAVCLLLTPGALTKLLDVSAGRLPERTQWIARDEQGELQADELTLSSNMRVIVNDVLTCSYKGAARRAYMRAKSLELLSNVVHELNDLPCGIHDTDVFLSPADIEKLEQAKCIMTRELDRSATLAALARRVGLNRTKLARGFKDIYGVSVQAFWRDKKLCHARELLQNRNARVTDVAFSLGYSEVTSFTRAFNQKFGFLPGSLRFRER